MAVINGIPEIVTRHSINPSMVRSDSAMVEPQAQPPGIVGTHEEYQWEWAKIKPQLLKWKESGVISDDTKYYVIVASKKYGKHTFEEFINLSIDDSDLFGKFGARVQGNI